MKKFAPDLFVLAMLFAICAALIFPGLGRSDGPLKLGIVTQVGIALVFFLHGATLSLVAMRQGLGKWRVHVLVQTTTFLVFPAIGWIVFQLGRQAGLPDALMIGVFYLCALPSTVSSSVALTAIAHGNVTAAIFNASISGLIGMAATPLLVGLVAVTANVALPPFGGAVLKIMTTLLLPFVAGQLFRPMIGGLISRYKPMINRVDRAVIVAIVYSAFSDTTAEGLWSKFSVPLMALTLVMCLGILASAITITRLFARRAGLGRPDEIAVVFCGSKKSLATGAPMAKVLFAGMGGVGVALLPIILYHQAQLIVCSILARRYAQADVRGKNSTKLAV